MSDVNQKATLVGDREIMSVRLFDAPRELVFKAWTDPNQIAQWWGPKGFTTSTFSMEVKPGGVWRFVMHGPDGRDYENKVTYLEVVPPEKLVYAQGGDKETEAIHFHVTVTFEQVGKRTKLTSRMVFPSPDARDNVVNNYGAVEGLDQHLGRLAEHLAVESSGNVPFIISRTFDAPKELVWNSWTQRERLMQWWGPKGFKVTVANLDFKPGGFFHYCMKMPDGNEMWGKFLYREIVPMQRIVWINTFSDPQGGMTRHPYAPEWPQQMMTIATFAEHDGKTTVTIHWRPYNATELEQTTFNGGFDSMRGGWGGTFEQLADYLRKA